MQSTHRARGRLSLIGLGVFLLFIGSSLPDAPLLTSALSWSPGMIEDNPPDGIEPTMVEVTPLPGPTSGSAIIVGTLGGTLKVGRFALSVPAGAISGTVQISIAVPDPSRMECQLSIWPASANGFKLPVGLACDVTGGNFKDELDLLCAWRDGRDSGWKPIETSTVNLLNHTVYAPLYHFSNYGVFEGKAGW